MAFIPKSDAIAQLVHEKSIEILNDVGFSVPDESTLTRLKKVGFQIDSQTQMARAPAELIEAALKDMPKDVKLYDRSGAIPAPFGECTCFMGAGTPVNVLDLETGARRPATRRDVHQLVIIQDALPQVDIVRPTVTATDQGEASDLVEIAELLLCTSKPVVHRTLSPERVDAAFEMLSAVAGDAASFRAHPNFATLYCPISPGYFTPENIRCMLRWAEHGVPITILSMAMGGASAPATLLGELIVINTDILAWIAALQRLYPGTPLLYGSVSSVLDMRTGILPLGSPERGMINSGAALMARYYGIPSMCGGLSADAKQLDAQAGFEKTVTAVPLLLEQADIIYGVGATDAGAAISYVQMIFDNEMIGGLRRFMQSIDLHDVEEEVRLIKANTPRGNFLRAKHTKQHYKEHWQPQILNRDAYETWQTSNRTIDDICRAKAHEILSNHNPLPVAGNVRDELERILRKHVDPGFHLD